MRDFGKFAGLRATYPITRDATVRYYIKTFDATVPTISGASKKETDPSKTDHVPPPQLRDQ